VVSATAVTEYSVSVHFRLRPKPEKVVSVGLYRRMPTIYSELNYSELENRKNFIFHGDVTLDMSNWESKFEVQMVKVTGIEAVKSCLQISS